jgi:DNA-binding XRE family transcriptional regulator
MKTKPWREIRARKLPPKKLRQIDRAVEDELLEMDLRELREAAGKTQEELAEALEKAQSEISRLEGRSDYRLSTLQRYVAALGGELEVVASFGNRRVRLRAA